jgi:tetratricopeptide (TPR) repeat protein
VIDSRGLAAWLALAGLVHAAPALAAVPRAAPAVAEIVATQGDERVEFVEQPGWRRAEVKQDLVTGDGVQTGPAGALAILFRDATQIRVHRNSTVLIRSARTRAGAGETLVRLERGAAWSRARSLPEGLKIETPAATAAIRGTDWHLKVEDDGRSVLTVLAGEVLFANEHGAVSVVRGEIAFAEVGKAPTKTILVNPRDRPQWVVKLDRYILAAPVTGLGAGALRARRRALEADVARGPQGDALLELAEVVYEHADFDEARRLLERWRRAVPAPPPAWQARQTLLEGLLLLQAGRAEEGDRLIASAIPGLDGRRALVARISGSALLTDAEVAELVRTDADHAETQLYRVQRAVERGLYPDAVTLASEGERRFPGDTRFAQWLALVFFATDEPDRMREAVARALAVDPEDHQVWHLQGIHAQAVLGDTPAALAAYRRALALEPRFVAAWTQLAIVLAGAGDLDAALAAIDEATRLAPHGARVHASRAALLVRLDRLAEAEAAAREALALDPSEPSALQVLGVLALKRGEPVEAVDWMLRATVVNPGLAGATTGTAIAAYQAGDVALAEQAIANAARLDPNDPVPPLVGSIIAQDQAEAGRAVRLAREAIARYARQPGAAFEGLAKSQSGIVNLGSALANLGLTEWGDYHGQLSFNPAWATSHFFLSGQYVSAAASRGAVVQGLLLDPLAISARTRYYDFVHQPFHDATLAAAVGAEDDDALVHSQLARVQGLVRLPAPVAYFLDARRERHEGFRDNADATTESATLGLGTQLTHRDGLVFALTASRARQGVPGPEDAPDPDDRLSDESISTALGWSRRLGPGHHVLARVSGGHAHTRFRNFSPFGVGLSELSTSLVRAFGVDQTRALYGAGICDRTAQFPGFAPGAIFVVPQCLPGTLLASDLPASLDSSPLRSLDIEQTGVLVQARHLLEAGPVRVTSGVEWAPSWLRVASRSAVFRPAGTASLFPPPPGPLNILFPFGPTIVEDEARNLDRHAVAGYVAADWAVTADLRLEAALFLRHWEDGDRTRTTQPDPRAGLAWRPAAGHWLRVTGQRTLVLPIDGTLAPVAVVGRAAPDAFTTEGSSVTDYQARWDAEWSARLFTFAAVEQQRISRWIAPVPFTTAVLATEKARLRGVTLGANAWIAEAWGLFARHRWTWTENLSKGEHRGRDLPLVPEQAFEAGVTWIHPWQLRTSASAVHVGERQADLANTSRLPGAWTANASVSWQPFRKHWSFTLAGQNLFDVDRDLARGVPAPGRTVTLVGEYRF